MKKNNYFSKTWKVWLILAICVYSIIACDFEEARLDLFAINATQDTIGKLNGIIKNLSYSYIAGCVFFFLSDSLPFLRRLKIANRSMTSAINQCKKSLYELECCLSGVCWASMDDSSIFESITEAECDDDAQIVNIKKHKYMAIRTFLSELDRTCNFILSQELYLNETQFRIASQILADSRLDVFRSEPDDAVMMSKKVIMDFINAIKEVKKL